jgi:hypothetical protein
VDERLLTECVELLDRQAEPNDLRPRAEEREDFQRDAPFGAGMAQNTDT